jgi:hypothetical protein
MHSDGFAAAEAASRTSSSEDEETVTLTESTAVLELLLQYMYRQPQPDLQKVDFKILAEVAEAAEKYQVYSATYICKILMKCVKFRYSQPTMINLFIDCKLPTIPWMFCSMLRSMTILISQMRQQ